MTRDGRRFGSMERISLLDRLRENLLDGSSLIIVAIGMLSIGLTILRDHSRGIGYEAVATPAVAISILLALFLFRRRIPASVRIAFLLVLMFATATKGLLTMGVVSPTGFWIMVAVVLTWVLVGARGAKIAMVAGLASIAFCGWFVANRGAIQSMENVQSHSSWLMWNVLLVNIVSIFWVLYHCTRGLVRGAIESEIEASADKDRLQGILEGIDDAVFLRPLDEDRIYETNRGAQLMFAWTDRSLMGARIGALSADESPWTSEALEKKLHDCGSGSDNKFVWWLTSQDGRKFWAELSVNRFRMGSGDYLLVSIRDVDEEMQEQRSFEKLNRKLESRVQSRTRELRSLREDLESFSRAVSHDLRAPLRAMSGYARVLEEDFGEQLEAGDRAVLQQIRSEVGELGRRIETLLS